MSEATPTASSRKREKMFTFKSAGWIVLAGIAIIMLPMFGDFYTAFLLSQGRPQTSMIGNQIQRLLLESTFGYAQARDAALVVMLSVLVSVLTFYYLYATARATREARR